MASTSPTQRTLKRLRELGYTAEVVERWNPYAKVRQDLFGFVDIVAVGNRLVLNQTTSASNHSARVKKIMDTPVARVLSACNIGIHVWSWGKKGARGKAKSWTLRAEMMAIDESGKWQVADISHAYGVPA